MQQRQEQEGTQHHFTHGAFQDRLLNMFEQQRQTSRPQQPTSELSFAELPRHAAVLRQQLQRLKDEVALLQVPSHSTQIWRATIFLNHDFLQLMQTEAMKERDRIINESRCFNARHAFIALIHALHWRFLQRIS
jgi:hypothetical protein